MSTRIKLVAVTLSKYYIYIYPFNSKLLAPYIYSYLYDLVFLS